MRIIVLGAGNVGRAVVDALYSEHELVRRELEQAIHREAVVPIRANGVVVDERSLRSAVVFVLLYLLTFALGALALLIDARAGGTRIAAFEAIGASAACIGRVEIIPIAVLLGRSYWRA